MDHICGCVYVHFEAVLGFTRKEQMGCLEDFRGKENGSKHPRNITSHVIFSSNILGENMSRPGEVQKCP